MLQELILVDKNSIIVQKMGANNPNKFLSSEEKQMKTP